MVLLQVVKDYQRKDDAARESPPENFMWDETGGGHLRLKLNLC